MRVWWAKSESSSVSLTTSLQDFSLMVVLGVSSIGWP